MDNRSACAIFSSIAEIGEEFQQRKDDWQHLSLPNSGPEKGEFKQEWVGSAHLTL
jgi:hypothetical protein